ncbi:ABC-three component system protein [Kitasatospora sp. NPDC085895]|uniref:ABC-three component system protein n=1 Tax=Kitasatospora sp. NPDC085895 TaxID=3155057 RepID=UPI00344E00FF
MAEAAGVSDEVQRPIFEGIPEPKSPDTVVLAPPMQSAPLPTPEQMLRYDYSADDWEDFTVEWVRALGQPYVRVQRMGGAGDKGADIAACLTLRGTKGEWHCYQCKHYLAPLVPSDAWPEIVKIFVAKVRGDYELPTRYVFVAPKIGTTLKRLLLDPEEMQTEFFEAWNKDKSTLGTNLEPAERSAVEALARSTHFSMFQPADMEWIVKVHSTTPHHVRRFPQQLPPRPAVELPPTEQGAQEAVFVRKLLDVYNEKHGLALQTLQEARDHQKTKEHLILQREAFYSAESLRVFARESVPPATYKAIENDLYHALYDVADGSYDNGYERLRHVLIAASGHQPNPANILAPVVTGLDKKGLCHHLANDDRLTWCKGEER